MRDATRVFTRLLNTRKSRDYGTRELAWAYRDERNAQRKTRTREFALRRTTCHMVGQAALFVQNGVCVRAADGRPRAEADRRRKRALR